MKSDLCQSKIRQLFTYDPNGFLIRILPKGGQRIGSFAGSLPSKGNRYGRTRVEYKSYATHRLIWIFHNGKIPKGFQIDHIDRDKTNNKITNLRLVTPIENRRNVGIQKNNSSTFPGVYRDTSKKKWRSRLRVKGKLKHLGTFTEFTDAVAAVTDFKLSQGGWIL